MKAVIQRVRSASVTVGGEVISSIGRGLMILIGIGTLDSASDSEFLVNKILALKLFPDEESSEWGWQKTSAEAQTEILCVSQFTLLANTKKGGKPDFHGAMGAERSQEMYNSFLLDLKTKYQAEKIFDGRFGAMMDVALVNDGPVTIILDSKDAPKLLPAQQAKLDRKIEEEAKAKAKWEKKKAANLEFEASKAAAKLESEQSNA